MLLILKKNKTLLSITFLLGIILLILTGCKAEKYGTDISKTAPTVKVKDIMLKQSYTGQTVNLEGIIITQCQSNGCWFFLHDGTGQIFINLQPAGITIPPKTGKKATVTGDVAFENGNFIIIARGLEIS